jgi:hypothetical protein
VYADGELLGVELLPALSLILVVGEGGVAGERDSVGCGQEEHRVGAFEAHSWRFGWTRTGRG